MPDYWIIVRQGRRDLLELLLDAFRGRLGFTVVEDRRERAGRPPRERRQTMPDWNNTDFFVAERSDPQW